MPFPRLATCLCLLSAACATNQGAKRSDLPPSQVAADYYPLLPGWGWAYDLERDGQTVLAVYAVQTSDGKSATVFNAGETIEYTFSPEGIARRDTGLQGDFLLKNPVVAGTRWPVYSGEALIAKTGVTVTVGTETYPNCVIVEETRQAPPRITRTTYAQGVGPVEIEMQVQDTTTKGFATTVHAKLRGVTKPEVGSNNGTGAN